MSSVCSVVRRPLSPLPVVQPSSRVHPESVIIPPLSLDRHRRPRGRCRHRRATTSTKMMTTTTTTTTTMTKDRRRDPRSRGEGGNVVIPPRDPAGASPSSASGRDHRHLAPSPSPPSTIPPWVRNNRRRWAGAGANPPLRSSTGGHPSCGRPVAGYHRHPPPGPHLCLDWPSATMSSPLPQIKTGVTWNLACLFEGVIFHVVVSFGVARITSYVYVD